MEYRVGIGFDIHRLVRGRKLSLGGIHIPFAKGLLGHSDGDVLLHAVCDALLGACGLGDIGIHFPDTDPALKGISGTELLQRTDAIIRKKLNYSVVNIDTIVICDRPKITPYAQRIRGLIAGILRITPGAVSVKAKTTEQTAVSVISSYATALIKI